MGFALIGVALTSLLFSLDLPNYRHELSLAAVSFVCLVLVQSKAFREPWTSFVLLFGTIFLMFTLAETYLTLSQPTPRNAGTKQSFSSAFYQSHRTLGFGAPTSTQVRVARYVEDSPTDIVYDVVYSFDEHARRYVPESQPDKDCVLFFGGSYTLGEGVADHETMPHQFSVASEKSISAINFGFAGYGPNHILRILQDKTHLEACDRKVRATVYTAIPTHFMRSAGLNSWGPFSPRYALSPETNTVVFMGPRFRTMSDYTEFMQSRESALISEIKSLFETPDALLINTAIVREAADKLTRELAAPFFILYWDREEGNDHQLSALQEAGFSMVL